jgi:hypothetical protein
MEFYKSLIIEEKEEPKSLLEYEMYRMIPNTVILIQQYRRGVNYIPLRYAVPLTAPYLPTENGCDTNWKKIVYNIT